MSSRDALAFFAGLGQGYLNQNQTQRQQDWEDEQRAYTREQQGRERDAYNLAQQTRAKMAQVATANVVPDVAKADTADNIDVGSDPTATAPVMSTPAPPAPAPETNPQDFTTIRPAPVPAPAPTQKYLVNGKSYDSQDAANAAAADYNAPSAQLARMSNVLAEAGDAQGAAQLRAQARQGQLADLQLSAAQRADVAERFNQDLNNRVHSFDDLADFVSKSKGDGQGGGLKVKAVTTPDGTLVVMNKVNDDGSLTPLPNYTFPNSDIGLNRAKLGLLQGMTTQQQLEHLHQQATEDLQRQSLDQKKVYEAQLADARAGANEARIEAARIRAEATAAAAEARAKQAREYLPPGVKEQYDAVAKRSEALQKVIDTARADPGFDPNKIPPGIQTMMTEQAVLEKRMNDIMGKYGPNGRGAAAMPLGAYDPSNPNAGAPTPTPVAAPAGSAAQAVSAAAPGSWVNPNAPRPQPGTPAFASMGASPLAIANPFYAKAREEAAARAANSLTAAQAYEELYGKSQHAQMTH